MRSFELDVRGITIRGVETGDPSGRPILATHGWLDNAATWAGVRSHFEDFRFIAIDFPGHGLSDHRPANAEYHYVNWVADVIAVLDALSLDSVIGLGHSMGAGVQALAAGAAPDRYERLCLVEGLGPFTTSAEDAPGNLGMAMKGRNLAKRERSVYPDEHAATSRRLQQSPDLDLKTIAPIMERGLVENGDGFSFGHDGRLHARSILRFTEGQVLSFLSKIECPTLVVRADQGLRYNEEAIQGRLNAIQDSDVVTLEGGHHIHLAKPELVAPVLRRFLG